MRLFVDVHYKGNLTELNKLQYSSLTGEIAKALAETHGPDWTVERVGTAPYKTLINRKNREAA